MKKTGLAVVLWGSVFTDALAQNPVLRDPHLRDEDISGTQIQSSVQRLPGGIYEYRYDVASPATNKGRILSFVLDVSCDLEFGSVTYPDPPDQRFRRDLAPDRHLPIQPYSALSQDGTNRATPSVGATGAVSWLLGLNPGKSLDGLRILSPAPPGLRQYRLSVSMNVFDLEADGTGWDYASFEGDESVPWIPDFEVRGVMDGPACALPPPNPPPPPPPGGTFPGSAEPNESSAVNSLLTYSAPLRDRFHVEPGVTMITMTVHYSKEIDPKTFRAEPGWAKPLFNPSAGATETVVLPLRDKKSLFQLEAKSVKDKVPRKQDELDQSYTDRDVFEIRQTPVLKTPPGKNR